MKTGTLYLIATPIGNLSDITFRALDVLKKVQLIAAEDTRHSRKLLQHYQITTPMISLHNFNEVTRVSQLMERLEGGESVGLISDAGTPLISDPGYSLVRAAQEGNFPVVPIPGACAAIAALCAAGLPTDRFIFEGFLPAKTVARKERLSDIKDEPRTIVFYESPHRIKAMLKDLITILGPARRVTMARELTKQFETIHQDEAAQLLEWIEKNPEQQLGEFVLVVAGSESEKNLSTMDVDNILAILVAELPTKQAASLCAKITGHKKNELYERALLLKSSDNS